MLSPVRLFATPWTPVHGILQARILDWVAVPFSRGSSEPRDRTHVFLIAGRFFTRATRETPLIYKELLKIEEILWKNRERVWIDHRKKRKCPLNTWKNAQLFIVIWFSQQHSEWSAYSSHSYFTENKTESKEI